MQNNNISIEPDRRDYWIACGLTLMALAVYIRTLAPDILYGDSAEFQTLAYTLGYTHSTGYPIFLLLARLVGFIPIGNLAWRINLFSAISAAVTVGGVYLLARYFTHSRLGPILGSFLLAISYTFWSQAIIAEVYTPGTAFLVVIMILLFSWQESPNKRNPFLILAAFLSVIGVGVHASVGLLAPVAVLLVVWVWVLIRQKYPEFRKSIASTVSGVIGGGVILLVAFLWVDFHNPGSSFINVMLEPSRSIWHLRPEDIDSPSERIYLTMTGLQWRDAMFPKDLDISKEMYNFVERASTIEFHWSFLLIALIGLGWAVYKKPRRGIFLVGFLVASLYYILHYNPPDKYVFYLSLYVPLAVAGGFGIGLFLDWLDGILKLGKTIQLLLHIGVVGLLAFWMSAEFLETRWRAVNSGAAYFVKEEYVYPVKTPKEPRATAEILLSSLPENAVLIMDWRALYTTYYIAHVEKRKPDIRIIEATPHGSDGNLADSLIKVLTLAIQQGHPVFSNAIYGDIERYFGIERSSIHGLYRLSLKK